jgi:hypothetical protein
MMEKDTMFEVVYSTYRPYSLHGMQNMGLPMNNSEIIYRISFEVVLMNCRKSYNGDRSEIAGPAWKISHDY